MADQAERKILDMVEQGQVSADEGLRLINAMQSSRSRESRAVAGDGVAIPPEEAQASQPPFIPEEELARMKRMKRWWVLPFGIGLIMTLLGAIWMYSGYMAKGFGVGFWLAWLPFLLGIVIVAVSFPTSKSVWLHVRIKQKPGETPQRISISMPLPLRFAHWFFFTFGDKIPDLKDQSADDVTAILESLSPEEPFYVNVNDEDGEAVEVFIG